MLVLVSTPFLYTKIKAKLTPINIQPVTESGKSDLPAFTLDDLAKHNDVVDCWLLINQNIYDVTEYIPMHPNNDIVAGCGLDATDMFQGERKHRGEAANILDDYLIGYLDLK